MLPKIKEVDQLKDILDKSKTFFLTLHLVPDADACGSMLCFYEFLKRKKKNVYLYSHDRLTENLKILPNIDKITHDITEFSFDVAIFFECSTPQRSGIDVSKFRFKKIINIDHHKTAKRYGDVNIIYPQFPSTAEIIWSIMNEFNFKLTKTMAVNLYSGIITDTGRFQYPQTLPETFYTAGDLIKYGFDFKKINDNFFNTSTYKNLKLLGVALSSLVLDNGIGYMIIRDDDFKLYNADFQDTENIINYPMMIPDVKAVFLVKEDKDKYNVTFRSKGNLDVSNVALKFGGGGHKNASGFRISKDKVESIDSLVLEVLKCLKNISDRG